MTATALSPAFGHAQAAPLLGVIAGTVADQTGGALPGVTVDASSAGATRTTSTDADGRYRFDAVPAGRYELLFRLVNFSQQRRTVDVAAASSRTIDVVLSLSLDADVTVTGRRTFANLADAENPAENLVGIAQSSSQGAITPQQLEARPMSRTGEVLETVPGVVISQHSGEGKANQYYLRGFNLDHGTDFATTVAGMPVNLPTHAHGHGYSDLNFLIPELVSGVQFSKGPYFADQGDFATAGAANINYVNAVERPIVQVAGGQDAYGRALFAASPKVGDATVLAALEVDHNDGPWDRPDGFGKVNGVVRYSRGDTLSGLTLTAMGYHGQWHATDQIPSRAVSEGVIGRFGSLDPSDGGRSSRYSASFEWQRTAAAGVTRVTAYGIGYDLDLFSNFTFFLDDPVHGDQFEQADHRVVGGGRVSHRRLARWADHPVQNTIGLQLRSDDIGTIGLYHTEARRRLGTTREDRVRQTGLGLYAENEVEWSPRVRTTVGLRADVYRFQVDSNLPVNSGTRWSAIASPKGGVVVGPWGGTEWYANAGLGFHSNDARGATIVVDPATGTPVDRVTPLARATGAEIGVRTVAVPHLQSTLTLWTLALDSELVFVGDAGTTEAGRPSRRSGVEWANYWRALPFLVVDGDVSWSRARFRDRDPAGDAIPGSVGAVVSGGVTADRERGPFGALRLRYFGPRPLVEDNAVRSEATSLLNLEAGYAVSPRARLALDVFNLLDAHDSDIDYFYSSRLSGEPAQGIDDRHFHPTLPRTLRIDLILRF